MPQPEEDQEPDEDKDFNMRMKLPTEEQLREAFSKLSAFKLQDVLPKKLDVPLSALPPEMRLELDGLNMALEKNVVSLFAMPDVSDIKESLLALVSTNDRLLIPDKVRNTRSKSMKKMGSTTKGPVLLFYPHLLEMIQALLSYHVQFSKKAAFQPNHPASIVFTAWMQVLAYLISIQNIIVYGAKKGILDLKEYPLDIDYITGITERSINKVQKAIEEQERSVSDKHLILQDQEEKIAAIQQTHQTVLQQLANHQTLLSNLRNNMEALTDPQKIALKNVEQILKTNEAN